MSTISLENGKSVTMSEVQVGDRVQAVISFENAYIVILTPFEWILENACRI